jgi:hypothetical protein
MENVNVNIEAFLKKVKNNEERGMVELLCIDGDPQQIKWFVQNVQQQISQMLSIGILKKKIFINWVNNGQVTSIPKNMSYNDFINLVKNESQIIGDMAISKFSKAYEGTGLSFKVTGGCRELTQMNGTFSNITFGGEVEVEIIVDENVIKSKKSKINKKETLEGED